MALEELNVIGAYNTWADNTILKIARQLSDEQLHAQQAMGFGSVFETLVHIMASEHIWLQRWQGSSPDRTRAAADYHSLDALESEWNTVHAELEAFFAGLTPERYNAGVAYKTTSGTPQTQTLSALIWHLINHSTEHRAQVAAACTMAGCTVGDLNIIHFLRL